MFHIILGGTGFLGRASRDGLEVAHGHITCPAHITALYVLAEGMRPLGCMLSGMWGVGVGPTRVGLIPRCLLIQMIIIIRLSVVSNTDTVSACHRAWKELAISVCLLTGCDSCSPDSAWGLVFLGRLWLFSCCTAHGCCSDLLQLIWRLQNEGLCLPLPLRGRTGVWT